MIKKLLPILLILIGGGGGIAAGLFLKPAPAVEVALDGENPCGDDPNAAVLASDKRDADEEEDEKPSRPEDVSFEYAKLDNQFVVPLFRNESVDAVVVLALSLEMIAGTTDTVYTIEPKLRDSFLQVMFDHAALGGFDGAFANNANLRRLRRALLESATGILDDRVNDVLITNIAKQDMG